MRVEGKKIVDVTAQDEPVIHACDSWSHGENAGVGLALSESELKEPREERTLPSATSLRHAVN
eukprot:3533090-Pleurochrysis_carterae.AAC.1